MINYYLSAKRVAVHRWDAIRVSSSNPMVAPSSYCSLAMPMAAMMVYWPMAAICHSNDRSAELVEKVVVPYMVAVDANKMDTFRSRTSDRFVLAMESFRCLFSAKRPQDAW